jgi:hypothetical protein
VSETDTQKAGLLNALQPSAKFDDRLPRQARDKRTYLCEESTTTKTLYFVAAAIVSLLTGEVSPSGRLTNTWVRDASYIGTAVQPYWQYRQV